MEKEQVEGYLQYFSEAYDQWCTQPNNRTKIEERVFMFGNNLPDELYIEINSGNASGLFQYGFFETDLLKAINYLNRLLNNGAEE